MTEVESSGFGLALTLFHVVVLGVFFPSPGLPVIEIARPACSFAFSSQSAVFYVKHELRLHVSSFYRAEQVAGHSPFRGNRKLRFSAGRNRSLHGSNALAT